MAQTVAGAYDKNNLKFRKAFIRERLATLKEERDSLLAERTSIEEQLTASRLKTNAVARTTTADHTTNA